jgi:hypothetical protein
MADNELYDTYKEWDANLVEGKPSFTTVIGGSAVSLIPNNAQSSTTSNITYTVTPPSINVVLRRAPLHDLTCVFGVLCVQSDGSGVDGNSSVCMDPNGVPFAEVGRHIAVACPAPISKLSSNVQINFNNVSVQAQNTYWDGISQMLEGPHGRADHGVTMRNPLFASWDDADGTLYSLGANAGEMLGTGDMGPGGFNVQYCFPDGNPLPYSNTIQYYTPAGVLVDPSDCIPRTSATVVPTNPKEYGGNAAVQRYYTAFQYGRPITHPLGSGVAHWVWFTQRFIDPVMVQPLTFNERTSQKQVGLYGISTMTFQFQFAQASLVRLIQNCTNDGCILLTNIAPFTAASTSLTCPPGTSVNDSGNIKNIMKAVLWTYYLSQPINTPLVPRSVVPYVNFQYWTQTNAIKTSATAGDLYNRPSDWQKVVVNFTTVTLGNVPSKLVIWTSPTIGTGCGVRSSETNWICPMPDNPIQSWIFANQSGSFSGWPSCQFTSMSIENGSMASIPQYGGYDGSGKLVVSGLPTMPGGGVLVVEPGKDFPLPALTAMGSAGQVQLSFSIQIYIPAGGRSYTTTLLAMSDGFFCTQAGISRQVNVGLDEKAVDSAKVVDTHTDMAKTHQLLGLSGGSFCKTRVSEGAGMDMSKVVHLGNFSHGQH